MISRKAENRKAYTGKHFDPPDRMNQKDNLTSLGILIDELPEKQRTFLQLRDIEGKVLQGNSRHHVLDGGPSKGDYFQGTSNR